jgi:hypothetical protein
LNFVGILHLTTAISPALDATICSIAVNLRTAPLIGEAVAAEKPPIASARAVTGEIRCCRPADAGQKSRRSIEPR